MAYCKELMAYSQSGQKSLWHIAYGVWSEMTGSYHKRLLTIGHQPYALIAQRLFITACAAAIVFLMSASVWAVERKAASNWDGAK